MKNMNKIYGLNIDALRLCYEVTEPNNINIGKSSVSCPLKPSDSAPLC